MEPAGRFIISEQGEGKEHTIHIFTDGSKNEHGVGSGSVIYMQSKLTRKLKHKLHDICPHNKAVKWQSLKDYMK